MESASAAASKAPKILLTLGKTENGDVFKVDANLVATGRTCVIGSSGSGKSYTVGVICEELLKAKVPFAILDTEGEHKGLKTKFDLVRVGDDAESDLHWSNVNIAELAKLAPGIAPLILDVSETIDANDKIQQLLTALYFEISELRTPYLIIVEEADKFFPQNGEKLPIFQEIAQRGRKRGMGLLICTQRPALVDKQVLSQCSNQVIGKLNIKNDLMSVNQFFYGGETPKDLTALSAGKFFVKGEINPTPCYVQFRAKETTHMAQAPTLERRSAVVAMRSANSETLEALKSVTLSPEEVARREKLLREASIPQKTFRAKFKVNDDGTIVTITTLLHAPDLDQALQRGKAYARKMTDEKNQEWNLSTVNETRHRWMPTGDLGEV